MRFLRLLVPVLGVGSPSAIEHSDVDDAQSISDGYQDVKQMENATAAFSRSCCTKSQVESVVSDAGPFNVSNLQVEALVLSHRVEYLFNLTYKPDHAPIRCDFLGTSLIESINNVTSAPCGTDGGVAASANGSAPAVTFSWTQHVDGSADFEVVHRVSDHSSRVSCHRVAANETLVEGDGEFRHQIYVGPANFSMPAFNIKLKPSSLA